MTRFHSLSLLVLLVLLAPALRAQTFDADASRRIMGKSVDAIGNVASSLVSDSLTPMTHFDKGEWNMTLVPAYFRVRTAYDDPSIDGKGLNGADWHSALHTPSPTGSCCTGHAHGWAWTAG
jgi:hypothetical protein